MHHSVHGTAINSCSFDERIRHFALEGRSFYINYYAQGLPIVGWIAARDDIPPDAFLSKNQNANYICRVGKKAKRLYFWHYE